MEYATEAQEHTKGDYDSRRDDVQDADNETGTWIQPKGPEDHHELRERRVAARRGSPGERYQPTTHTRRSAGPRLTA